MVLVGHEIGKGLCFDGKDDDGDGKVDCDDDDCKRQYPQACNAKGAGAGKKPNATKGFEEGATVCVTLPWGKKSNKASRTFSGTVVCRNDEEHHSPGSYTVDFDEPVPQPSVFHTGDAKAVSSWGGRGAGAPASQVGCAKGAHQMAFERGLCPAELSAGRKCTSPDAHFAAVLDFLESEGRAGADVARTEYCHKCTVFDEDEEITQFREGAAVECTYCARNYHVDVCANLSISQARHAAQNDGKVGGAWACDDCVSFAEDKLGIERVAAAVGDGSAADPIEFDISGLEAEAAAIFGLWGADHLKMLMAQEPDFLGQESELQEKVAARGHIARFLPKFHCGTCCWPHVLRALCLLLLTSVCSFAPSRRTKLDRASLVQAQEQDAPARRHDLAWAARKHVECVRTPRLAAAR